MISNYGIYAIYCLVNGKVYIGSSRELDRRYYTSKLNKGTHENSYLQNSWNKHGKYNFIFYILEYSDSDDKIHLTNLENFYIESYKSWNREFGYNIARDAYRPSMTPETRKKIGLTSKGRRWSEEAKTKARGKKLGALNHNHRSDLTPKRLDWFKNRVLGENNPNAIITSKLARVIKYALLLKFIKPTLRSLCSLLNLHYKSAWHIKKGDRWITDIKDIELKYKDGVVK